jgi:hypothetical protein
MHCRVTGDTRTRTCIPALNAAVVAGYAEVGGYDNSAESVGGTCCVA